MNWITGLLTGMIVASAGWWIALGPLGRGCARLFGGV